MENKKIINVKIIGTVFFVLLLTLIFFSKTIYTYNLPTVTATTPQNGNLNKTETTTGIVDFANIEELYSEIGGKIDDILVREGDTVERGQALINMSFDSEDIDKKLEELYISRNKLNVDIENINLKLNKTNRNIDDLKNETYNPDTVSDYELLQIQNEIANAEENFEKLKVLYESGIIPKGDIDTASFNLQNLQSKYENIQKTIAESTKKSDESLADKEKSKQKQLADYQYEIELLNQDLKTKSLDLSNLAIQETSYKKALTDYNKNTVIYANEAGTIISFSVKKGQHINENQQIASVGIGNEYKVECDIALANNFVVVGDKCDMYNSSHTLEGVVSKITPYEQAKKATIFIESEEISSGETFEIRFEKESAQSYTLVPNGTVNKDSDGYFIYQIKRREGILGKEFYAQKLKVYIGDSDTEFTAVTKGISFFEPIVLLSDKSFSENDTIKLKNESDFFEK